MPRPPHSPWFDLPNDICWWLQIMKLLTVQLSPFSRYFIPLRSKYSPQQPVLKHPQSKSFDVRTVKMSGMFSVSRCMSKFRLWHSKATVCVERQ
jgi:hypothetical protein